MSERAPSVCQGGGGATHHGAGAWETRRDAGAIPGLGHRHRDAMNLPQGGGRRVQVVVTGIERSKGQDFAGSQSDTDIDEPEPAMCKGSGTQSRPARPGGRLQAHDRQPQHPVEHAVRTRRALQAQHIGTALERPRDGPKTEASFSKHFASQCDHLSLRWHNP